MVVVIGDSRVRSLYGMTGGDGAVGRTVVGPRVLSLCGTTGDDGVVG